MSDDHRLREVPVDRYPEADRLEEGGWQKAVARPRQTAARPACRPRRSRLPSPTMADKRRLTPRRGRLAPTSPSARAAGVGRSPYARPARTAGRAGCPPKKSS